VTALDAAGFQVHFHALGDRAVRESLDAVEAARRANGGADRRHHLAHLQVVDPHDRTRFAALEAGANAQPLWAHHDGYQDDLTIPFLGPDRSALQYPWRSLLDAGASLALGSDWPVSAPDPMQILHVAVHRTHPDGRQDVFYGEERISLLQAIRASTMGSAWLNHDDETTGSIEPDKRADLVVLDRDLTTDPILGTRVTMTLVAGEVVHAHG
jgi:predicted amidohydrolase YtcJ